MSEIGLTLEILEKGKVISPFSTCECSQTLTPISQGSLRRTINGELVCVGYKGHQKFHSTIACKDKISPGFEGLWKGDLVKVGCVQSLTQAIPENAAKIQLERQALSFHVHDSSKKIWKVKKPQERWLSLPTGFPGGFITYRPLLWMIVKKYHLETDEWGLTVSWTLELEEL